MDSLTERRATFGVIEVTNGAIEVTNATIADAKVTTVVIANILLRAAQRREVLKEAQASAGQMTTPARHGALRHGSLQGPHHLQRGATLGVAEIATIGMAGAIVNGAELR